MIDDQQVAEAAQPVRERHLAAPHCAHVLALPGMDEQALPGRPASLAALAETMQDFAGNGQGELALEAIEIQSGQTGVDDLVEIMRKPFSQEKVVEKMDFIAAFEHVARQQGEGIRQYLRRFLQVERKMLAKGIRRYDDEARAFKFLATSRISQPIRNNILMAAGN